MLRSRVLTWNAIAAFSEECIEKFVSVLLYLVVSSTLEH